MPSGGSRLLCALSWRDAEEDDEAHQLVGDLLRPIEEKSELLLIVGGDNALAFWAGHASPRSRGGVATVPSSPEIEQICVPRVLARLAVYVEYVHT